MHTSNMLSFLTGISPNIIKYLIACTVDERCDMELDETDPTIWLKLEGAADEYIQNNSIAFKNLAERLLESMHDEKFSDSLRSQPLFKAKGINISNLSILL